MKKYIVSFIIRNIEVEALDERDAEIVALQQMDKEYPSQDNSTFGTSIREVK